MRTTWDQVQTTFLMSIGPSSITGKRINSGICRFWKPWPVTWKLLLSERDEEHKTEESDNDAISAQSDGFLEITWSFKVQEPPPRRSQHVQPRPGRRGQRHGGRHCCVQPLSARRRHRRSRRKHKTEETTTKFLLNPTMFWRLFGPVITIPSFNTLSGLEGTQKRWQRHCRIRKIHDFSSSAGCNPLLSPRNPRQSGPRDRPQCPHISQACQATQKRWCRHCCVQPCIMQRLGPRSRGERRRRCRESVFLWKIARAVV